MDKKIKDAKMVANQLAKNIANFIEKGYVDNVEGVAKLNDYILSAHKDIEAIKNGKLSFCEKCGGIEQFEVGKYNCVCMLG